MIYNNKLFYNINLIKKNLKKINVLLRTFLKMI